MKIGQNNCEIVRVNTSGIPKIEEVLHNKLACYIIRIIFLQNILLSCNLNPFEWGGGGRRWPSTGIKGKVKLVRKMQTCSSILQKSDSRESYDLDTNSCCNTTHFIKLVSLILIFINIGLSAHKEMLNNIVAALMQKTQIQTKEMPCIVKVLTFINPMTNYL